MRRVAELESLGVAIGTMKQAVILLLLYLVSVAVTHADEDIYNPLSVGLRWEASVDLTAPDGRTIHGSAIREIAGTEVIAGKTYFKSVTRFNDIPGMTQFTTYRRKTKDGIYAINGHDPEKREYLETGLPLSVGKTWTATSTDKETTVFSVERQETVTVRNRKYEKCFKVSYRSDGLSPSGYFYLAPNIGNVIETFKQGGATFQFTLKSFTGDK
jgi:hypothetical protein